MQTILSDYNCEGQAQVIFQHLKTQGYLELVLLELRLFADVGLAADANDETVWRFCQERGFLLLTGNRRTSDGEKSLEMTIRRLATDQSLPVLTISNLQRVLMDAVYRADCAQRLAEIALNLENYQGVRRLYLPR